ncbi:MAG TPA: CDP-alcohol phosphatidyltransferase family protein [Tepidisphaeraceae bacterium]|jgi:phosphatidylglycerophosphate synthase
MWRHVPNILTTLRLLLAAAFFVLLSFYQYEGRGDPFLLSSAFIIYISALVTDYLDGYLARKWHVEGAFGRVVDPFADKILVLGSFIFFAGKNFIVPESVNPGHHMVVKTLTGVTPGMVIILLARELLVTTLRGLSEGAGQSFGAVWAGKFKMGFQSGTILVILIYVTFLPWLDKHGYEFPARAFRDFGVWGTVIITLYSGIAYVRRAVSLFQQPSERPA